MRRYRVITHPPAELDLEEAWLWVAAKAPQTAARWLHAIRRAILSLDSVPQRCSIAPESPALGYEIRQLIFGAYRVLFTIEESTVHVLHVRHTAREPMNEDEVFGPERP